MGARRRGRWTTTSSTPWTSRQQPPGISPRDKALYAQHDAGATGLLARVTQRDKTAHAQHDQAFAFAVDRTRRDCLRTAWQGVAWVGGSADITPLQPSCASFFIMQINIPLVPCSLAVSHSAWCVGHCAMLSTTKRMGWIAA